ncbi:zinc finger BED domain-containing protein RICESLEEPER 2-like protein [Tanacetum coccineum]
MASIVVVRWEGLNWDGFFDGRCHPDPYCSPQGGGCALLSELYGIKEELGEVFLDASGYMKDMATEMKKKFDKYWGCTNLLISIGSVLDPRYKMELIDFSFKAIYSADEVIIQKKIVRDTLDRS